MANYKLKHKMPDFIDATQVFMSGTIQIPEDSYVDGYLVSTKRFLPFDYGDFIVKMKDGLKIPIKKEVFEYLYESVENDNETGEKRI